jgi:hypothetical protein
MPDPSAAGRYRRPVPGSVPDLAVVGEQAAFTAMAEKSQEDVTASAERWRTGLAGLTTVVTGGLLLKGPATAADVDVAWRAGLTVLFGLGIVASITGLWFALRAAAGVPTTVRFDALRRDYGTVRLYRLDVARRAALDLRRARRAALLAALLLATAILAWWWAPPRSPAGTIVTVTHGAEQSCGTVVDSDASGLRLATRDSPTRIAIPWASVTTLKPVTTCGAPR